MQILVEPSALRPHNVGDQAMLEVCCRRLRQLWPDSDLGVTFDEPTMLNRYAPEARSLPSSGREQFFCKVEWLGRYHSFVPPPLKKRLSQLSRATRRQMPELWTDLRLNRQRRFLGDPQGAPQFTQFLRESDLYVFSGAGMLTDAFAPYATPPLRAFEFAADMGKTIAITGQMIGPIKDDQFAKVCREVLPRFNMITVREPVSSLPYLENCGVEMDRVLVTGDEVVEGAFRIGRKLPKTRDHLGLNIRVSYYSGFDRERALEQLSETVASILRDLGVHGQSMPISYYAEEDDDRWTNQLFGTARFVTSETGIPTKLDLIHAASHCRVVVTASYHAAVFSLSQGIPVIGISSSEYYKAKFEGLQAVFGDAIRWIDLTRDGWAPELKKEVMWSWRRAEQCERPLLQAAARQAKASRRSYRLLRQLVDTRNATEQIRLIRAAADAGATVPMHQRQRATALSATA